MASISFLHIDAFTDEPFAGNPAAVCLLRKPGKASWMQAVAAEMNLSETAFVHPESDRFGLRWFTPTMEIDLCGHATLASAYALWTEGIVDADTPIPFNTKSGVLTCAPRDDLIELDFPATPAEAAELPKELIDALGVAPEFTGRSRSDILMLVESEDVVRSLEPDFTQLRRMDMQGLIVTSTSKDPRFDFISRYFAPGVGIDEDPVTGATHCCLGPFWGERLGKSELTAYQASARGGIVHLRLAGERVILGGHAVTVAKGVLTAPAAAGR